MLPLTAGGFPTGNALCFWTGSIRSIITKLLQATWTWAVWTGSGGMEFRPRVRRLGRPPTCRLGTGVHSSTSASGRLPFAIFRPHMGAWSSLSNIFRALAGSSNQGITFTSMVPGSHIDCIYLCNITVVYSVQVARLEVCGAKACGGSDVRDGG